MSVQHHEGGFVIVGTAGHVDHGKSALVKRLTGTDPDRLQEERERGLTIDLGFASLILPGEPPRLCGIVDVPGHERFVKNMLAGATGIDLVLLVVAADEGVMPQTREHIDIIDLLGIGAGIVVITKRDLVEPEMIALVEQDTRAAVAGTALADSPVVAVSAVTGEGMDELLSLLSAAAAAVEPRDVRGPARLPIDRVFTIKGHGTVVTGSLVRGVVSVEDKLEVVPGGLSARVRRIERYGSFVDRATAPARLGVNLTGPDRDELQRGDQLVAPGSMRPSHLLDVQLRIVRGASRPLAQRERVRVHHCTSEVLARVVLLEGEVVAPGQSALAQLHLEAPVAAARGDRFVIRRYSPAHTIGGGEVIDPVPAKHRRRDAEVVKRLHGLVSGGAVAGAAQWVRGRGLKTFGAKELATALQTELSEAEALLAEPELGAARIGSDLWVGRDGFDTLRRRIADELARFHRERPAVGIMPAPQLQAACERPPAQAWEAALRELSAEGVVAVEAGGVRLAGHSQSLTEGQAARVEEALARIRAAGLAPPERGEVLGTLRGDSGAVGAADFLDGLVHRGAVVLVGELCFSGEAFAEARQRLRGLFAKEGAFTVAQARDVLESSRKYVLPLLEQFDSEGFTRRTGDLRSVASEAVTR